MIILLCLQIAGWELSFVNLLYTLKISQLRPCTQKFPSIVLGKFLSTGAAGFDVVVSLDESEDISDPPVPEN